MARAPLLIVGILLSLLMAHGGTALADSAPVRSAGPGLQPVHSSKVRMESERIEILLQRRDQSGSFERGIEADVRVLFHFVPTADEAMEAGFPLEASLKQRGVYRITVQDLTVTAQGKPLIYEKRKVTLDGESTDWAIFRLAFKKGQPLDLEVRYHMAAGGNGKHADAALAVTYILQTGRFWEGSIGKADVVLRADRPLREEDMLTGATPGYAYKDGQFSWQWLDLEPDFDLTVQLKNPWWLELPDDLRQLLSKEPFGREELLRVAAGMFQLYHGSDMYEWPPVRDGRLSGEAANALMPEMLERFEPLLKANPQDWELRRLQICLLAAGLFTYPAERAGPPDPGLRQRYEAAVKAYEQDGGPPFENGTGVMVGARSPGDQQPPALKDSPPAAPVATADPAEPVVTARPASGPGVPVWLLAAGGACACLTLTLALLLLRGRRR